MYTIIKVPDDLASMAREVPTRRVEGHLDAIAVNVGLNRADDIVHCRLTPADPDHVPMPDDLADALDAAGRRDAYERRPASERRRLLAPIENAARPETRHRRLRDLIAALPVD